MTARLGPDDDTFVIEDEKIFRIRTRKDGTSTKHLVCGFVVYPLWECTTYADRDLPRHPERRVAVEYVWLDTHDVSNRKIVELEAPASADFGQLLARHVPDLLAQLSVRSAKLLGAAVAATTGFTFVRLERYRQTGWRSDGTFAFPLAEDDPLHDADLRHICGTAGAAHLAFPVVSDAQRSLRAATTLLRVLAAAPIATAGTVLGTILAGPLFRRPDQLGARGFTTLIVAPTGLGKTTFASRIYSLLGGFHRPPHTLEVWSSTPTALESVTHALRDLTVLIDDFRDLDGTSRESFRKLTMAVGNTAARGRARATRSGDYEIAARSPPRCLVLATAESEPEGDAGEAARLLVVTGDDIDVDALLGETADDLDELPHLFKRFIEWLGKQDSTFWAAAREERRLTAMVLRESVNGRVVENLSTVASALLIFGEFVRQEFHDAVSVVDCWTTLIDAYRADLTDLARNQAARVAEETLDGLFLAELARGVRTGEILIPHTGQAAWRPHGPLVVGYYDHQVVYLRTAICADWVGRRLQSSRRRKVPLTAKALVQALRSRGGETGVKIQKKLGDGREKFRKVERRHLGEAWDGLLDEFGSTSAGLAPS